jgi:hypothetical protein
MLISYAPSGVAIEEEPDGADDRQHAYDDCTYDEGQHLRLERVADEGKHSSPIQHGKPREE